MTMMTVLVMSGGLTRDPTRQVEAFFTESNNSASCFLPDLPADRNFNTLDYIEGKLVLCGGDGESDKCREPSSFFTDVPSDAVSKARDVVSLPDPGV